MGNTQFAVDWEQRVDFARLRDERLQKTREGMAKVHLDALLLFKPVNIRYSTGAKGVESYWDLSECAFVPLQGPPTVYLSAGIGLQVPWFDGHLRAARNLHGEGAEGDEINRQFVSEISALMGSGKDRRLGVDILNVSLYKHLEEAGFEVLAAGPALTYARALKTPDEIALLKVAAAMNDAGLYACRQMIRPGAREYDVSASLIETVRKLGADWYIRGVVCSGEHTSPQYKTVGGTDRIIQPNDLVLIDAAHAYMSYWSDVARVFICEDRPTPIQREVYKWCHEALMAGLEKVKPGNTTADVVICWKDMQRRAPVSFVGVGHGIGTTLHEIPIVHEPSLAAPTVFAPGMVIALEVYASRDRQGVRLEDNLIITEEGHEVISKFPYEEAFL